MALFHDLGNCLSSREGEQTTRSRLLSMTEGNVGRKAIQKPEAAPDSWACPCDSCHCHGCFFACAGSLLEAQWCCVSIYVNVAKTAFISFESVAPGTQGRLAFAAPKYNQMPAYFTKAKLPFRSFSILTSSSFLRPCPPVCTLSMMTSSSSSSR